MFACAARPKRPGSRLRITSGAGSNLVRTSFYLSPPAPIHLIMTSEATAQILALITSVFYASALVSARAGMRYSTPTTVTLVSIVMQNVILWTAVFVTGAVHAVPLSGVLLFTLVGIFQLGVRLFAYTGVEKIGASRSSRSARSSARRSQSWSWASRLRR